MEKIAAQLFEGFTSACHGKDVTADDAVAALGSALGWALANISMSLKEDLTPAALDWIEAGKKATLNKLPSIMLPRAN